MLYMTTTVVCHSQRQAISKLFPQKVQTFRLLWGSLSLGNVHRCTFYQRFLEVCISGPSNGLHLRYYIPIPTPPFPLLRMGRTDKAILTGGKMDFTSSEILSTLIHWDFGCGGKMAFIVVVPCKRSHCKRYKHTHWSNLCTF